MLGASYSWTGAVSDYWDEPLNWAQNVAPGKQDSANISQPYPCFVLIRTPVEVLFMEVGVECRVFIQAPIILSGGNSRGFSIDVLGQLVIASDVTASHGTYTDQLSVQTASNKNRCVNKT